MPHLLELPNEILDQIIDDTVPESVEAFSLSCEHIGNLAKTRLEHYFEDVATYCDTVLTNRPEFQRYGGSPLDLLRDFLQKPYLVRYPQQLNLGKCDKVRSSRPAHSDELRNQVVNALTECSYVPSEEIQEWATKICHGKFDAGSALLLALLPNIQSVRIEGGSFSRAYVRRMLYYIAEGSHDIQLSGRRHALSRVVEAQICHVGFANRYEEETEVFAQLSAIPTMKYLRCVNLRWSEIRDWTRLKTHGEVTKIEFFRSEVDPDVISQLLEDVRALRIFTYVFPGISVNMHYPSKICNVLRQHANHTLEELILWWASTNEKATEAAIDDLRDFQILKKVSLRFASITTASENGTLNLLPLTSVLPPSIEHIRLLGDGKGWRYEHSGAFPEEEESMTRQDLEHLVKLFDGLPAMKEQCLPNLVRIDCQYVYSKDREKFGAYQQIREACMSAGVTLYGLGREEDVQHWVPGGERPQKPFRSRYQSFSPHLD